MSRLEKILPHILQALIWIPTRFLLWFFGHFEIVGKENLKKIPRGQGVIFAANHTSKTDLFLLPASLPVWSRFMPIFYVSRDPSMYTLRGIWKLMAHEWYMKIWGAHKAIAGTKDYEKSLEKHIEIMKEGKNLLMFIEGKIQKDPHEGKARGGVSFLAHKTGSAIVPLTLQGVYNFNILSFLSRRRRIKINFGEPIFPEHFFADMDTFSPTLYKKKAEVVLEKIREPLYDAKTVL